MGSCCCKRRYLRRNLKKKIALLLVGLDNAGKTTAAKGLAGEVVTSTIPTVGFSAIKPKTEGYDVTIFDLGGGVQIRDIWSSYFHFVHGVIYVVDASDLSRIEESKTILENLLRNEKLAGKPVLVLANKQDKPSALDEIDVVEVLHLEPLVNQQKCHTLVKVCSAVPSTPRRKKKTDKRLISGYKWLLNQILKEYEVLNARVEADSKEETEKFEARRALQRKRLEESAEETELSNGVNGGISTSDSVEFVGVPRNITSTIRDQLEEKNEHSFRLRGRRNKVHPMLSVELKGTKIERPIKSSPQLTVKPSMTFRALTSPLHGAAHYTRHSDSAVRYSSPRRPLTSKSLGHEAGVWGLQRELDIIHPSHGEKDEIVIEYIKKE